MYLFDLVEVRNINGTFGVVAVNEQENQAYLLRNVIINTSESALEGCSLSISCTPEKYVYRGSFNTASEMKNFAESVLRLLNEASRTNDAFKAALDARDRLNQLNGQLANVQAGLRACHDMPNPTDFQVRLSDQERKQIRGLYASGLYTKGQLAYQYGVAQQTIARIIDGT